MNRLVFILLFFVSLNLFGQTPQLIKEQGDRYYSNEQYFKAIEFYKRALLLNEDMTSAKFQIANSYRLTFDYESAEAYYGQVVSASGSNEVYPLAGYYYGLMKKLNGDLQGAIIELDKAIESMKSYGYSEREDFRKFYIQAKIEKQGCQFALNELTKPKINRDFRLLEDPVNTEFNDYAAFTFQHDSILAVSSGRSSGTTGSLIDNRFGESFADIFRFEYEGDEWVESKDTDRFSRIVNSKWGDGAGAFNIDRTKFYYTNCDAENQGGCFIYVTELVDGKWTEPKALNENVNKRGYNSKHPTISPAGDTLFFSSDRPNGYGHFDIWFSVAISGEYWGVPQNMGPQVNTDFNEISPYYDSKESALFFASDGHRGFGGLDIFLAKGNYLTNPEIFNIGAPYNSNKDECFFMLGETTGYISSNRDGGLGKFDIYAFNIETDKEVISEIQVEEAIAGRNSIFSDDYDFDTPELANVEKIISQLLAAQFAGVDAVLTSEEKAFYENLSQDDKDRIDRIVKARFRNMAQSDMRALRVEDEFYYQNLGYEERQAIDQMIVSRLEQQDLGLTVRYDNKTLQFYESLPKEDKERVDQFIAFKLKEAEDKKIIEQSYETLEPGEKRQVNSITTKYFKEKKDISSLSLNPTSLFFINGLEGDKKQTVFTSIKERITNLSEGTEYELNEQDRIFYQNLNSDQLDNLKNIATAFLTSDLEDFSQNVGKYDIAFYQQLNTAQKASADRVLAKLINNLVVADLYVADVLLSKKGIELLSDSRNSVASISIALQQIPSNDISVEVPQISEENINRLERFVASLSSRQFVEDKLIGFYEDESVIASSQPVADAGNVPAEDVIEQEENTSDQPVTPTSTPTTSTSGSTDLIAANQATNETSGQTDQNTDQASNNEIIAGNTESDNIQTQETSDDVSVTSESITEQQTEDTKTEKIVPVTQLPVAEVTELSPEDASYYDEKETEDRQFIDRIIGARFLNNLGSSSIVASQAYNSFKDLSAEQKDYVKILAKSLRAEESVNPLLLVPALNFYSSSAASVKEKWNLMVYTRALDAENGKYRAKREDYQKYNKLPEEEKAIIERIQEHRLANNRLIPDVQAVDALDIPDRQVIQNLVSYNTGQYEFIYISGVLTDEKTGRPLTNFPLAIQKKNGELAYQTYTDAKGSFEFENIKSENYNIVSGSSNASFADQGFFIRDLEVRGASEDIYDRRISTKLYFDSGSKGLRKEVIITLDEIVGVYKDNPDMIIELHGHTDNIGDEEVNLSLSKERSESVFDYLVKQGVPSGKIIINFFGQSKPVTQNMNAFDRQFNRRVDVMLKSENYISFLPANIYLVRPKGTFYSIAKNFKVDIDEIREWNGMSQGDVLEAYRPLRIKNPKGMRPNLDMLVELNASVDTGYKEYVVKSGDTLSKIAQQFNIPEELLLEINNLDSLGADKLEVGSVLKIYVSY